jgi:hypothetical protein
LSFGRNGPERIADLEHAARQLHFSLSQDWTSGFALMGYSFGRRSGGVELLCYRNKAHLMGIEEFDGGRGYQRPRPRSRLISSSDRPARAELRSASAPAGKGASEKRKRLHDDRNRTRIGPVIRRESCRKVTSMLILYQTAGVL